MTTNNKFRKPVYVGAFFVGMESFISLEPNSLDLNPKYVSIIQSLVNSVGNSAGFIVPLIAAEMTKQKEIPTTSDSELKDDDTHIFDTSVWHTFFWLSAVITFSGGELIYTCEFIKSNIV